MNIFFFIVKHTVNIVTIDTLEGKIFYGVKIRCTTTILFFVMSIKSFLIPCLQNGTHLLQTAPIELTTLGTKFTCIYIPKMSRV